MREADATAARCRRYAAALLARLCFRRGLQPPHPHAAPLPYRPKPDPRAFLNALFALAAGCAVLLVVGVIPGAPALQVYLPPFEVRHVVAPQPGREREPAHLRDVRRELGDQLIGFGLVLEEADAPLGFLARRDLRHAEDELGLVRIVEHARCDGEVNG